MSFSKHVKPQKNPPQHKLLKKNIVACIVTGVLLCTCFSSGAGAESVDNVPYSSYTFLSGYNTKRPVVNKASYVPEKTIDGSTLGISSFSSPQDLFYENGNVYILDSGNSRILVLDGNYKLKKIIQNLSYQGHALNFQDAQGLFVDSRGNILVADTTGKRILIFDESGRVKQILLAPNSNMIPDNFNYSPVDVVEDQNGFIYVLSNGSYYGALVYSNNGSFFGFYGANKVAGNALTAISKIFNMVFSNNVKRSKSVQKLPYQFTGLCIDQKGFIYTLTTVSESGFGQIRELSPGGDNIMTFKSNYKSSSADYFNFGDQNIFENENGITKTNNFSDICVDDSGYIYALDSTYGKVFIYDNECNLISIFGGGVGSGSQLGTFKMPSAITTVGDDILVADSSKNSVTVFRCTDYCKLIKKADLLNLKGEYLTAMPLWRQIYAQDKNYQLAYSGLAKGYMMQGNYLKAMEFSKEGLDRDTYAQAFQQERSIFINHNFLWIFILFLLVLGALIGLLFYTSKKRVVLVGNVKLRIMLTTLTHPFDAFNEIKYKKQGSVFLSFVILFLFYSLSVINILHGGFMYVVYDPYTYNAIYTLLGTVGILILWVVANWSICALMEGKGRIKEIFIVSCYSLIPQLIYCLFFLAFSHILIPQEASIFTIALYICNIWTALLIIFGTMVIHEFEFTKSIGTGILTILGMAIIAFIIVMVCTLFQDFIGFIVSVLRELILRYNG